MILTQLETLNLPRPYGRNFKRSLVASGHKAKRRAVSKFVRTRSRTITTLKSQYYLPNAYSDLRVAVARNEDIFLNSTMVLAVMGLAAVFILAELLVFSLNAALAIADISGLHIGLFMLQVVGVLGVLYGWLGALLMNMLSISIMDGSTRKVHRSIRSTMRKSLSRASMVASSWLLLATLMAGPMVVASVIAYLYVQIYGLSLVELLSIMPYGIIAALTWVMVVVMNYGLAPYVALFEPKTPILATFSRSRQLVKQRGKLFLLATYGSLVAVLSGAYLIFQAIEHALNVETWLLFAATVLIGISYANALLVMLYRKRKLARKIS